MPLSRFTQTLPLDFAEATSESEAAPVAGAFVEVFFGGAELVAGALEVEELAGVLGAIVDLLDAGVAGAELAFDAGAVICESLAAVDFFLLFLVVVAFVSLLAFVLVAAVVLGAGAAAVVSALFLRLFLVVVLESAVVPAVWSPLAAVSVDFFLRLFFVVLVSAVVPPPALAD
jgi:hypothetical protein